MKKGYGLGVAMISAVIFSGCELIGDSKGQAVKGEEIETPLANEVNKVDENKVVPATVDNMTLQVLRDGDDGYGSILFKVIVKNTAPTKIDLNTEKFMFNKSHADEDIDIDIPATVKEKKIIKPGETVTYSKILGPVTSDTPGYYYLEASYDQQVFWTQMPALEEFR